MNPTPPVDLTNIKNIYSLLATIVPPALTIMGTIIIALITNRNKKSIDEAKKDTTEKLDEVRKVTTTKLDDINSRQEVMHDAINSQQAGLIDAIKKAAYAEGVIDGIKKEQLHMTVAISDELIRKDFIKKDQEVEAAKIIAAAILAKDTLIQEANINKQQLDSNITRIKEDIIHDLNKKLIRDK